MAYFGQESLFVQPNTNSSLADDKRVAMKISEAEERIEIFDSIHIGRILHEDTMN